MINIMWKYTSVGANNTKLSVNSQYENERSFRLLHINSSQITTFFPRKGSRLKTYFPT
jgi:hypothetical protein